MALVTGITQYQKEKWMNEIAAKITAGSLKGAIYSTTTALDATTVPGTIYPGAANTTALTYTVTGELTSTGTGYTAGGYVLSGVIPSRATATKYQLDFSDIVTAAGTIATGSYALAIYDTTDSNRILSISTVTVSTASAGGAMTFTIPPDALAIT